MRVIKEVFIPGELQLSEEELDKLLDFRIILEHISDEMKREEIQIVGGISLQEITTLYNLTTKIFEKCKIGYEETVMNYRKNVEAVLEPITPKIPEEIAEDFCNNYCKWPLQWDEEKEGCELPDSEHCKNCPLNKICGG